MTPADLFMAVEGHNKRERGGVDPMTRAELNDLIAMYPSTGSIKKRKAKSDG